jgi:hypothetical protein
VCECVSVCVWVWQQQQIWGRGGVCAANKTAEDGLWIQYVAVVDDVDGNITHSLMEQEEACYGSE